MKGKTIGNRTFVGLIVSVLVLVACSPAQPPAPTTAARAQPAVQQQGWQQDWEKTVAAARKEGKLVIYVGGGGSVVRQEISNSMRDKYGVDVEWMVGSGSQISAKIIQERQAGMYVPDFIVGSTTAQQTVHKPGGHFDPIKPLLVLPEVLDKKVWLGGDIPWVDNEKMYTMNSILSLDYKVAVNTNMVKPDEIKSYNDLLDPRWKGKIIIRNPNASIKWFSQIKYAMGLDFMKKLAAQQPVVVDSDRLGVEWLAQGKYPIFVVSSVGELSQFVRAGAPVSRVLVKEASFLGGGIVATSLLKNAPHPNAAKVYANWYLSKEGAIVVSRALGLESGRLDVPADHVSPDTLREASAKYVNTETEEFFTLMNDDRTVAREIFR